MTQHVAFSSGAVRDIYAKNGYLRFIISTDPGSVVRRELRSGGPTANSSGVELMNSFHASDGTTIVGTMARNCGPIGSSRGVCAGAVLDPELENRVGDIVGVSEIRPILGAQRVVGSEWVVDLDVSSTKQEILSRANGGDNSEPIQGLVNANALATWGFTKEAEAALTSSLEVLYPESQDTILDSQLVASKKDETELRYIGALLAWQLTADFKDVLDGKGSVDKILRGMPRLAAIAKEMDPADGSEVFSVMADICRRSLDLPQASRPRVHTAILKCRDGYDREAALKAALDEGLLVKEDTAASL